MNSEIRRIERDITGMQRAEQRSVRECKKLAQEGQPNAARILAKEIVQTRKAMERMHQAKAQMNSVKARVPRPAPPHPSGRPPANRRLARGRR